MTGALAGFVVGALAGSVPFSWLLHRLRTGRDLRTEGSGNPGATNLLRAAGIGWGLAGLALDAGKGAAAVLLASRAGGEPAAVAAAVGAVFAHVFSPWLGGRGGKGVATAAGAFAVLAPIADALAALVFLIVVAATRLVALGSVASAATLVTAAFLFGPGRLVAAASLVIAALVAWRHRENFARMRAGIEPRLGSRGDSR
jgi:glycerol-3-phosphate acyltransferase PlsY